MDSLVEQYYDNAIQNYNSGQYEKAFDIFYDLAKKNIPEAQMEIGYMLYEGKGCRKNIDESLVWFKKNEVRNNSEALRMMGWCYLKKNNIEDGIRYINKALEMENIDAILDIGSFYDLGEYNFVVEKKKALTYYTKGCSLGSRYGCKTMGLLLQEMNMSIAKHVEEHIGFIKFFKIVLQGNIIKIFINMIKENCFFKTRNKSKGD